MALLKFCQIIYNCPGIQINKKVFRPQYFKICSFKLNRWINHSLGEEKRYYKIYDERAKRLGFKKKRGWHIFPFDNFPNLISNIINSNIDNLDIGKQKNIIKQTVKAFLKANDFHLFHFSYELKNTKGYNFSFKINKKNG